MCILIVLDIYLDLDLHTKIVTRNILGQGYKTVYKALSVPWSTVASVILIWKMFGTTMTHPRVKCPPKPSNRKKGLGQGGDEDPNGHSNRASEILCSAGRTWQNTTISTDKAVLHPYHTSFYVMCHIVQDTEPLSAPDGVITIMCEKVSETYIVKCFECSIDSINAVLLPLWKSG